MASIFTMFFLIPCLVIRNTCIDISFLYYNVLNYTPRWFFIFRLMFRMYNRNIETLDVKKTGRNMKNLRQVKASVTSIPSEHRCIGQVSDAKFIHLTKYISVCVAPFLCTNCEMINCPKLFLKRELL